MSDTKFFYVWGLLSKTSILFRCSFNCWNSLTLFYWLYWLIVFIYCNAWKCKPSFYYFSFESFPDSSQYIWQRFCWLGIHLNVSYTSISLTANYNREHVLSALCEALFQGASFNYSSDPIRWVLSLSVLQKRKWKRGELK